MKEFRGGKKRTRDKWYGFEGKSDFEEFKRWFHKVAKKQRNYRDVLSREEMEEYYDEWKTAGHSVKFLTIHDLIRTLGRGPVPIEIQDTPDELDRLQPNGLSSRDKSRLRKLLRETKVVLERSKVAMLLAESGDEETGSVLVALLQQPDTCGSRGVLLYALEILNDTFAPLNLVVDLALTDTYEAREQAVDLICLGLYVGSAQDRLVARKRFTAAQADQSPHTVFLAKEALKALTEST